MSEPSRRRPWLAVVLALLISGLGHAYLRRWARAFGWYAVITATLVFLVPDAAVDQLLAREAPPVADVAPGLAAVVASVVDAYVLAVRHNRRERESVAAPAADATGDGRAGGASGADGEEVADGSRWTDDDTGAAGNGSRVTEWLGDRIGRGEGRTSGGASSAGSTSREPAPSTTDCPHCGRGTDAELDFCQWCTEPLDADAG
jgi:hypothetical protein